jgi:hypothetical protein
MSSIIRAGGVRGTGEPGAPRAAVRRALSRSHSYRRAALAFAAAALALGLAPAAAWACACGCGIFDVGASTYMASSSDSGWSAYLMYTHMDQNHNRQGNSSAPAAENHDKDLKTSFYFVGAQYLINRNWGLMFELPVYDRSLTTTDDGTVFGAAGSLYTAHITDLGDLQVMGLYSGLSDDLSTVLLFGLKLPTGNYTGPTGPLGGQEIDRDSLPGTGSTDPILGAFHVGGLNADNSLAYYVQARYQFAVFTRNGYRAGNELDGALGLTYNFGKVGPFTKLAPVLTLLGSNRAHDSGPNADPPNSGYGRLLLAPGLDLRVGKLRIYGDVELPIYQNVNADNFAVSGNSGQLVTSVAYKLQVAYDF